MDTLPSSTVDSFNQHWRRLGEEARFHYAPGRPATQVQFAFQNHFRVFSGLAPLRPGARVLEVGCGRGSMGAYFSAQGQEVHLLDVSLDALRLARRHFAGHGLSGHPVQGDAFALPYPDRTFDVVVSIGLLEHFDDIAGLLREQARVLRPGGTLLGYVVPDDRRTVQVLARPVNTLLRLGHDLLHPAREADAAPAKSPLYRNAHTPQDYLDALRGLGLADPQAVGMYPLPMVSHSPAFPFSPMAPALERALIGLWRAILGLRRLAVPDPWLCSPSWGLAYLVWGRIGGAS